MFDTANIGTACVTFGSFVVAELILGVPRWIVRGLTDGGKGIIVF